MCNETTPAYALPQNDELESEHTRISVSAADRSAHRAVERDEWVLDGTPAQHCDQSKKSSLIYYAEHVGRAAVLAAALGVGAAIAGAAGTASAATAKADTTVSAPSTVSTPGGRSAADKTADGHSRTAAGPSKTEKTNRSEKTENKGNSRLDAATTVPESTLNAARTNPAVVKQVRETAVVPQAVPASPATAATPAAVQSAPSPTLWSVLRGKWSVKTVAATTTPAPVPVAGGTAAATATVVSTSNATVVAQPAKINLPASATVFTLRGRGLGPFTPDRMPAEYGGIFSQAPYTMQALKYDTWGLGAFAKGVQILDNALMSTSGNIIVMAHSEGAEIASRWIRQYANDPTRAAMASRLTFLLSGNPVRPGTGYLVGRFEGDGEIGVATPTNSPWKIVDVARRWDGWADWPTDPTDRWAVAEAEAGKTTSHLWYSKVDLYSPQNTVWQQGNTTFVLTHEDDLQILKRYRNAPADFVSAVRAEVEAGYNRPSADIPVPVQQIQSAHWRATFARLVGKYGDPAGLLPPRPQSI